MKFEQLSPGDASGKIAREYKNNVTGSVFTELDLRRIFAACAKSTKTDSWAKVFIADCYDQFNRTGQMTQPQLVKLEEIYAKYTD